MEAEIAALVGLVAAGSGETLPARTRLQADGLLD